MSEVKIGAQKKIGYTSSKDLRRIEAWMYFGGYTKAWKCKDTFTSS